MSRMIIARSGSIIRRDHVAHLPPILPLADSLWALVIYRESNTYQDKQFFEPPLWPAGSYLAHNTPDVMFRGTSSQQHPPHNILATMLALHTYSRVASGIPNNVTNHRFLQSSLCFPRS